MIRPAMCLDSRPETRRELPCLTALRAVSIAALACAALASAGCDKSKTAGALPPGAVAVTADDKGFSPSSVTFKKGAQASLVFTRTSDDTCATEVVFPELKVTKPLPKNQPVTIDVPTDKEQKLTFQCGMGMYKSAVVINP